LEILKISLGKFFNKINNVNHEIWNICKILENICLTRTLYNYIKRFDQNLGLCDAKELKKFLLEKIAQKHPIFNDRNNVTFRELQEQGCYPLKVVASDLVGRQAVIYPLDQEQGLDYSVIDAVRASMSFPFVFSPVKNDNYLLVDGGLSSNLPLFLFEEEDDAVRYAMMLEEDPQYESEMEVVEVDDELAIKTCKRYNYKYAVITPNDIVVPPKL
jgi:NTE family protein